MPETPGISGLSNTFEYFSDFERNQKQGKAQSTPINLKIGETLLSEILQVYEDKLASVRLPIGTLNAYLEGNLKAGDKLFLQVAQLKPYLLLKIHSVPVIIQNVELKEEELLRLLNVPIAKVSIGVVKFLKQYNSIISRDDVLDIISVLNKIPKSDINQFSMWQIFSFAYFLVETKVLFNLNMYNRLKELFFKYNTFFRAILELLNDTDFIILFKKYYKDVAENADKINKFVKLLNIFSTKLDGEEILFLRYLNSLLSDFSLSEDSKSYIRQILNFSEAGYLYSLINFTQNNVLSLFFSFFMNNRLYLARILYKKRLKQARDDIFEFLLLISTENYGEIQALCKVHNEILEIEFFTKNREIIEILKSLEKNLIEELKGLNYKVSQINYIYQSLKRGNLRSLIDKGEAQSLSIVV